MSFAKRAARSLMRVLWCHNTARESANIPVLELGRPKGDYVAWGLTGFGRMPPSGW